MQFDIIDATNNKIGAGFVFPDGVTVIHGTLTGSSFYASLRELRNIHPSWFVRDK